MEQKNHMFDVLTANIMAENWAEAEQLYSHLPEIYGVDAEECQIYPALLQVVRWKKLRNDWEKKLVSLVLKNVLEELFYQECLGYGLPGRPLLVLHSDDAFGVP